MARSWTRGLLASLALIVTALTLTVSVAEAGAATSQAAKSTVCGPGSCRDTTAQTLHFTAPALYRDAVLAGQARTSLRDLKLSSNKYARAALSHLNSPIVAVAAAHTGRGYYLAESNGQVIGIGAAKSFKAIADLPAPIVAITADPHTHGVWLLDADGDVYARDTATSYGSVAGTGATTTSAVGIAATTDGKGYFIAESDGQVLSFGDAHVSEPAHKLRSPVVGITVDPAGTGYWLLSRDGTVTAAGQATRFGLASVPAAVYGTAAAGVATAKSVKAAAHTTSPVVAIAATRDGQGYLILHANGDVSGYGDGLSSVPATAVKSAFVGLAANPAETGLKPARTAKATLRVSSIGLSKSEHPKLTVTGPGGFDRHLVANRTFHNIAPGRYKIVAAGVRNGKGTLNAQWRTTTAVVGVGAAAHVTLPYDEELSPLARSLTPSAVISVKQPSAGHYVVRASDPTHGLASGDVLAIAAGPKTPEGLLLKLGSLTRSGQIDSFDATRAELTDLAPVGAFSVNDVKLTMPSGEESSRVGKLRSHDVFSNSQLSYDQDVSCTGSSSVEPISGGLSFQPSFAFNASWGGFLHPLTVNAAFEVGATEGFNYSASFTGSESCQYSKDLLKKAITLGEISLDIDGVPVVITPELNFQFQATGSVQGAANMSVSEQASEDVGLEEIKGKVSPIRGFQSNFSLTPLSASASASFQVGINPQITFGLYDTGVGPFIGAYGYLEYDAQTANPWWDVKLGLQPNAGLSFKLFGHGWAWTYNWDPWTTTLAQATTPLPPSVTTASLPNAKVGSSYSTTLAVSGTATPITIEQTSSLPPGMSFNPVTHVLYGTPTQAGTYTITVLPYDHDGQLGSSRTYTLTVAPAPLLVTTSSLAAATVGTAYASQLQASGGVGADTWTLTSGTLPAGLSLNAQTGAISGTPTAAGIGTASLTFQATDSTGTTATTTLKLSVAAPKLVLSTAALPNASLGANYDATLSASGGVAPYTWAATGLPNGLTLNTATGEITGSPNVSGSANLAVTVTDSKGTTSSGTVPLTVTTPGSLLPNGVGTFEAATEPSSAWDTTFSTSGGAITNDACLTAGTSSNQSGGSSIAGCNASTPDASGSGALQLTTDSRTQVGAAFYNGAIPTSAGLDITFDTYQYDTDGSEDNYAGSGGPCNTSSLTYPACSGADGIAFSLAAVGPNPSNTSQTELPSIIGPSGANLGYASNGSASGLQYGYLGVGFDAFGNFARENLSTGSGCTTPTGLSSADAYPESVDVHGPGNGTAGYCIISTSATQVNSGTGVPDGGGWDQVPGDANNPSGGGLDDAPLAPATGAAESTVRGTADVPEEVIINPAANAQTVQSTDDGGAFTVASGDWAVIYQAIGGTWQEMTGALPTVSASSYPSGWIDPDTGLPYQMTFGWTSSTGSVNEVHEINNVQVHPTT